MKSKKKAPGRNLTGEHASPRVLRNQKKGTENVQNAEKKASDMITSSARKPRAGALSNITVDSDAATNLQVGYHLVQNLEANISLVYDTNDGASMDCKDFTGVTDHKMSESIFSPTFHIAKSVEGEIADGDLENCVNTMIPLETHTTNSFCNEDLGTNMSSEVSAIYLAMKNSKLECVEEQSQDSLSTDVCNEEAEYEEFEDFDPYLFIKNLPELSMVVPTFRPMLLPKQTRSCPSTTLVLDLDETLVHSTLEPCDDADFTFTVNFNLKEHTVYVRCRPYLKYFMERVASLFEIIIFTASQSIYAEQLLNVLDPKRKVFRHRVYRESCVFFEGNYLKDLSVLGRDLARIIIIDNSPQAFGFQVDNGIPIESWFDDSSDQELLSIIPFLESLVGLEDVRPMIAKKFNLREKIAAAAVYPSSDMKREPF